VNEAFIPACFHPSIPNGSLTSNLKQTSNHILRADMPLLNLSYSVLRVRNHPLLAQSPGENTCIMVSMQSHVCCDLSVFGLVQ
jgi:hypothetical protein